MSVKTGWLKDHNGDKFAPKTYVSQVVTIDGIPIEETISPLVQAEIAQLKNDLDELKNSENYVDDEGYLVLGSTTIVDSDGYICL